MNVRNRFTLKDKEEILKFAETNSIMEAVRRYNVSRTSIRNWMNPEEYLKAKEKRLSCPKTKEKSRIRSKKNYHKNPNEHNARAKLSRKRRKFKRLCDNANRDFCKDDHLRAFDIFCIAKKQKLLCALTGDKLTNETISIDHIIPKSKGGSNSPENIRLVHKDANLARRALSDKDFLSLCKKVVDHLDPRP